MNLESKIEILYEDNHLLVVNKPGGILSQEDRTGGTDLLNLYKQYLKKKYNKPGNTFLGLLHRLDRPVSGVMMFAKTSKAASRISAQIRKGSVDKTYLAIVEGTPPQNGFLTHYLLKNKQKNLVTSVPPGTKGAKQAHLTFQVLEKKKNLSLLKINLITGRPHQIRVQLTTEGFPVWGDQKYGTGRKSSLMERDTSIALHAFELTVKHPTLKKEFTWQAPPPPQTPWNKFKIPVENR